MSMKLLGRIIAIAGGILLVLSLGANPLLKVVNPLNIGNPSTFGWLQTLGATLGAAAVAVGLWLIQREEPKEHSVKMHADLGAGSTMEARSASRTKPKSPARGKAKSRKRR